MFYSAPSSTDNVIPKLPERLALIKQRGNTAFKNEKFYAASQHYAHAISSYPNHPGNISKREIYNLVIPSFISYEDFIHGVFRCA